MADALDARPLMSPDGPSAGSGRWPLLVGRPSDSPVEPWPSALTLVPDRDDVGTDELRARVVDLVPFAVLCLDGNGHAILVNAAWTGLTGRSVEQELGQGWLDAFPSAERPEVSASIRGAVQEQRVLATDVWVDTVIGARLLRFAGQPTVDRSGSSTYVLCASDVTEQVALEERLTHSAHHDSLTGLTNRGGFIDSVGRLTSDAMRTGRINALLFLDLDGFKVINDAGGHGVGDQVLQLVAERIRAVVRPTDVVARVGGDEFAVVVVDISTAEEAQSLAKRILRSLAEPMSIGGFDWRVGASIGISVTADDRVADLLARADASLYAAKAQGKGRIVIESGYRVPVVPEPRSHTADMPVAPPRAVASPSPRAVASPSAPARPFHGVHFYDDADDLLPPLAGYVGAGLLDGSGVIVVATANHRELLNRRLDKTLLVEARASSRYLELDAAETLRRIMRSGYPDPDMFDLVVGSPLLRSVARYGRVRAYGEMVGLLWTDGNAAAALRLEDLWNKLQERIAFPLLCAYPEVGPEGDGREHILRRHSHSLNAGS